MNGTKQQYLKWGAGVGAIVLATGAWSLWSQRQQNLQDTMADRLYSARTGWTAERQTAKISEFKAAQSQALYPKTIAALESIDREGKSTAAAQEARLWLAQIYLRHGQAALAAPVYERAVSSAHGALEKSMSLQGLAAAQEAQGQAEAALKTLDQAIAGSDSAVQGEILLHVARLALQLGQKDRAAKTLTQILEKHAATEWAQEAQRLKAELDASGSASHG